MKRTQVANCIGNIFKMRRFKAGLRTKVYSKKDTIVKGNKQNGI